MVVVFNMSKMTQFGTRLVGEYRDREVTEVLQFTFRGSRASLVYDAWAPGEHELKLQIVDQGGNIITIFHYRHMSSNQHCKHLLYY